MLLGTRGKLMEILFLIGRIIFGSLFVYWGQNHFPKNMAMAGAALIISIISSIGSWPISLGG